MASPFFGQPSVSESLGVAFSKATVCFFAPSIFVNLQGQQERFCCLLAKEPQVTLARVERQTVFSCCPELLDLLAFLEKKRYSERVVCFYKKSPHD